MISKQQGNQRRVPYASTLITLVVIILASCSQKALAQQWNTNGNDISNTNTGNVGVGTTSPGSKLDVNGRIQQTGSATDAGYLLTNSGLLANTTALNPGIAFYGGNGVNALYGADLGYNSTTGRYRTRIFSGNSLADVALGRQQDAQGNPTQSAFREYLTVRGDTGNVGIGTATPNQKLGVQGMFGLYPQAFVTPTARGLFMFHGGSAGAIYAFNYPSGTADPIEIIASNIEFKTFFGGNQPTRLFIANAGDIGIGTTGPNYRLDVQGGLVNASGGLCIAGDCKTAWAQLGNQWTTNGTTINYGGGNVGIGVPSPTTKLDVNGTVNATALTINGSPIAGSQWATSGTTINYGAGNVGVGTDTPTEKLHVTGNVKVSGSIDVGGNINAKYQDVAEWVESSQELAAGTVVVLDSNRSNQVTAATQSYDSRVAGVISLRPGLTLGEEAEGRVLVATTGRVKVKVDATDGPIQIGDLLVTSDREGFAMKSLPVEIGGVRLHRPGTLIGKALEPLAKGTGEILVLLSLQ